MSPDHTETELRRVLGLLFPGNPYFLGATHGRQASIQQHLLMTGLASLVAQGRQEPIRIIEVGSWIGFSALTWAHAVNEFGAHGGEVACVDTWAPYFHSVDLAKGASIYSDMDEMARLGLAFALFKHNTACGPGRVPIRDLRGPSSEILRGLPPGQFDLIYLDGSHYYPDVARDIEDSMRLLRDGGILCGDDLDIQLGDIPEHVVRSALEQDAATDARTGRFYHPGVTLAVAERFGRVGMIEGLWYGRKSGLGLTPINPLDGRILVPPHFTPEMRAKAQSLFVPL